MNYNFDNDNKLGKQLRVDSKKHSVSASSSDELLCGVCDKPFELWMDGGELEDEVCFMCDQSYQEGALFDRDNFGDS